MCTSIIRASLIGPTQVHIPNGISIGSAVFAQITAEGPYTFKLAAPPHKIAFSHGEIWTPSNAWFLGPNRIHNPTGISIASAVFAGLTIVLTDRQTTICL